MQRGDFRARSKSAAREGEVFQSANPYAIDSVLRIVPRVDDARSVAAAASNGRLAAMMVMWRLV